MLHQMQHTNHSIFVSESAKVFSLQLYKDIFTKASILVTRINGFCFNLLGDNLPILEINEKKKEKKKERIALLSKDKKGVNQKFFSFFFAYCLLYYKKLGILLCILDTEVQNSCCFAF